MKPSRISQLLLALIRGEGSEYLRGDLEEWLAEESQRRSRGLAPRRFEAEVFRTLVHWWRGRLASLPGTLRQSIRWATRESVREARQSIRSLVKRPGYAALVVLVMGVGIGATTSVLTIVDRVLVRTLPYARANRLAVIGTTFPDRVWKEDASGIQHLAGFSLANFLEWEARSSSFEQLAALESMGILLPDRGSGPEIIQAAAVSTNFFNVLDARPALGRLFLPHEFSTTAADVAVLSHSAWVNRFGGDMDVLGQTLTQEEGSATIIGVLSSDFEVPEALPGQDAPFWFPIEMDSDRYANRGTRRLSGLGVLRPGASVETARAELQQIARELAEAFPDGNVFPDGRFLGAGANGLQAHTVGSSRKPILLFAAASALLLLIAGLNTANLTLVRGLNRDQEFKVRTALGGSRPSLVRLMVLETLTLAIAGGVLGLALAHAGLAVFRRLAPPSIPRLADIGIDARIVLLAFGVTLVAGLAAGLVPALRLTRDRSLAATGSRSTGGSAAWSHVVTLQVALSMLLMVSAGLLMESFVRLRSFEPGFDPTSALTLQQGVKTPASRDRPSHELWDEVLMQIRGVGGHASVAAASNLPYQSPNWAPAVMLPGDDETTRRTGIAGYVVTPGYFETLGIPLRAGRAFETTDTPQSQRVVVVNEAFIDEHLGDSDPLAMTLRLRSDGPPEEVRVVGVVGNTVQGRPEEGLLPAVYLPHTQQDWPSAWVFARTTGDPLAGVDAVRRSIAEINPYIPPRSISTMEQRMAATRRGARFNASLALAFGVVSLVLASGGLFGALSFGVRRRTKEIGVRLALGASRPSVLRLILNQGLRVTTIGVAIGLLASLLAGRLLQSFLFDVRPTSPQALAVVTASLMVVAVLASLGPAWKATRVDPVRSLSDS